MMSKKSIKLFSGLFMITGTVLFSHIGLANAQSNVMQSHSIVTNSEVDIDNLGDTVTKPSGDEINQFCSNIIVAARDRRYIIQAKQLNDLRVQVEKRIKLLEKRKVEYEDWIGRRNTFIKMANTGLVGIYKDMDPSAAAKQLELLNRIVAASVIIKLTPKQSSKILAEMKPDDAAEIASIIASSRDPNTSKDPS